MAHLVTTTLHVHAGDPLLVLVPTGEFTSEQVDVASWRTQGAAGVTKTVGSGVTVVAGSSAKSTYPTEDWTGVADTDAVLVVDVDPADVANIGVGRWRWQALAGVGEAKVVAQGWLTVTATVPAA